MPEGAGQSLSGPFRSAKSADMLSQIDHGIGLENHSVPGEFGPSIDQGRATLRVGTDARGN
ncbi:MAG: hypothetical protein Q8O63_12580 [Hoeflea sp.]|nr:hypothetical protein [Hoeflea sp.]